MLGLSGCFPVVALAVWDCHSPTEFVLSFVPLLRSFSSLLTGGEESTAGAAGELMGGETNTGSVTSEGAMSISWVSTSGLLDGDEGSDPVSPGTLPVA